jgi:hypothetical protein
MRYWFAEGPLALVFGVWYWVFGIPLKAGLDKNAAEMLTQAVVMREFIGGW